MWLFHNDTTAENSGECIECYSKYLFAVPKHCETNNIISHIFEDSEKVCISNNERNSGTGPLVNWQLFSMGSSLSAGTDSEN